MASNGKNGGGPGSGRVAKNRLVKREPGEVAEQISWEKRWMARLGVPAIVGGALYLVSALVISSTLKGAPTVGVLQGLEPALTTGVAEAPVSPRAAEVEFVAHHTFALIVGSSLMSLAIVALTATLVLLAKAARFRRPESWSGALPLVIAGGLGFAIVAIGHQVAEAVLTHHFVAGADHSGKAVEEALTQGTVNMVSQYVSLLAGLSLAVGMVATSLNGMRVGLLTRWMGIVGVVAAMLIFLPIGGEVLEVVPAFWIAAMGLLFLRRWPGEEPPAWNAGEARPWPTQADRAAERQGSQRGGSQRGGSQRGRQSGKQAARGASSAKDRGARDEKRSDEKPSSTAVADAPPAPVAGGAGSTRRRRRKHGSRR